MLHFASIMKLHEERWKHRAYFIDENAFCRLNICAAIAIIEMIRGNRGSNISASIVNELFEPQCIVSKGSRRSFSLSAWRALALPASNLWTVCWSLMMTYRRLRNAGIDVLLFKTGLQRNHNYWVAAATHCHCLRIYWQFRRWDILNIITSLSRKLFHELLTMRRDQLPA